MVSVAERLRRSDQRVVVVEHARLLGPEEGLSWHARRWWRRRALGGAEGRQLAAARAAERAGLTGAAREDASEVKLVGAVGREAAAADATAHVAIADGAGADVALHCRPWLGSDRLTEETAVRERFDNYCKMTAITKCIVAVIAFAYGAC
jgi:hypothetical protein